MLAVTNSVLNAVYATFYHVHVSVLTAVYAAFYHVDLKYLWWDLLIGSASLRSTIAIQSSGMTRSQGMFPSILKCSVCKLNCSEL